MALMPSADSENRYSSTDQSLLLRIACQSISNGVDHGRPAMPGLAGLPHTLMLQRSSFVTLTADAQLRGCIGSLEAHRPLADDVCHNAWAAAFRDPRFPPVSAAELPGMDIQVSVLSEAELLQFQSEDVLSGMLRPGIDGLIIEDKSSRGTFLPSVWESLPDPGDFLQHLKLKAGLPAGYWSDTVRVWRYTTQSFAAPISTIQREMLPT